MVSVKSVPKYGTEDLSKNVFNDNSIVAETVCVGFRRYRR